MAIQVKPLDKITSKWQQRAGAAGQAYADGINSPRRPQGATAAASVATWQAGVTAAGVANRFASHVAAADAKWSANSLAKGQPRFTQGVGLPTSATAFSSGIGPYLQVLASLDLSKAPKMPRGDPGNLQRVALVNQALHAKRVSGQ